LLRAASCDAPLVAVYTVEAHAPPHTVAARHGGYAGYCRQLLFDATSLLIRLMPPPDRGPFRRQYVITLLLL